MEAAKKKQGMYRMAFRRLRRNRLAMAALVFLLILAALSVLAPWIAPYHYDLQDYDVVLELPSAAHWFGTDNLGRDLFSRILYGGRISLSIGLISVGIAAVFGVVLGALAGYYGGAVDMAIMRFLDVFQAVPGILLSITISTTLGPGILNCMIAIGISSIPGYVRMMRGSILSVRSMEYIDGARAVNAGDFHIITRYIIPNALAPTLVQMTMGVASAITMAATLSFIGLGVQPPAPEWGAMLSGGRNYFRDYPHLVIVPGIFIMLTVLALNILGDGLRDALDPKQKG
jgi:peptide/nickel transport system permease protein